MESESLSHRLNVTWGRRLDIGLALRLFSAIISIGIAIFILLESNMKSPPVLSLVYLRAYLPGLILLNRIPVYLNILFSRMLSDKVNVYSFLQYHIGILVGGKLNLFRALPFLVYFSYHSPIFRILFLRTIDLKYNGNESEQSA